MPDAKRVNGRSRRRHRATAPPRRALLMVKWPKKPTTRIDVPDFSWSVSPVSPVSVGEGIPSVLALDDHIPMRKFAFLLVALALAYAAYPYWSLYHLSEAIEVGDEHALEQYVDWHSVRSGLKEDLSAVLSRETGKAIGSGSGEAAMGRLFASALGNALLDPLIDTMVTPQGLGAIIREGRAREGAPAPDGKTAGTSRDDSSPWQRLSYAFFTGPATFEAVFEVGRDDDVVGVMQLNGLRWQLVRLHLPDSASATGSAS
jgi:hypothetical protein